MLNKITSERVLEIAELQLKDSYHINLNEKLIELSRMVMNLLDDDGKKIFVSYTDISTDISILEQKYFYEHGFADGVKLILDVVGQS